MKAYLITIEWTWGVIDKEWIPFHPSDSDNLELEWSKSQDNTDESGIQIHNDINGKLSSDSTRVFLSQKNNRCYAQVILEESDDPEETRSKFYQVQRRKVWHGKAPIRNSQLQILKNNYHLDITKDEQYYKLVTLFSDSNSGLLIIYLLDLKLDYESVSKIQEINVSKIFVEHLLDNVLYFLKL